MENKDMPAMPTDTIDVGVGTSRKSMPTTAGLTKREYFAGVAMQGRLDCMENFNYSLEMIAEESVKAADALLEELSK